MNRFKLTPEEQEAVNSYYISPENQPELDEKEQKKNSLNNLLGFSIAFIVLILLGYITIVAINKFLS